MGEGSTKAVPLCCVVSNERDKMAFVGFEEYLPPLSAVDDTLQGVCLQWVTAECAELETEVDRMRRDNIRTAARQ